MKYLVPPLCLVLLLFLPGCVDFQAVSFFHPAYDRGSLVNDDRLEGIWSSGGRSRLVIERGGRGKYSVEIQELDRDMGEYVQECILEGHLFTAGPGLFFDFQLKISQRDLPKLAFMFITRTHQIARVDIRDDAMLLSTLDMEYLKPLLTNNPETIAHVVNDQGILITAQTQEIQDFLAAVYEQEAAFEGFAEGRREP